ncbi:MAG: hypothetical protein JO043_09440 [Candidatus Eremiobacteraeota bacterium]|nr:hypothetical protein [Candidatus Eremiobacteraeota bacterium]
MQTLAPYASVAVGAIATVLILISTGLRSSPYNNYVLLDQALLHGHTWIRWPGEAIDAIKFHDRYYVIEAPLPALLLLPAVYLFGGSANQTILSALLGGIAVGAAWESLLRLDVPANTRLLLVAFFMVGTDLWWCSMYGDVWFLAHAGAVCFTMLALVEVLGKRRPWLVSLLASCATGCRFNLVLALPVFAYLALRASPESQKVRRSLEFGMVLVPFVAGWVAYNLARWHVPYDIGYSLWYHQDDLGDPTGPPFKPKYLPFELFSYFVAPPRVLQGYPWLSAPNAGIALVWTSPALVLALLARQPRYLVVTLWATVAALWIPLLFYYANGASQFGMRHALDFEPFVLVLMALGVRRQLPGWGTVLLAYSVLFGFWGLWYWRNFFRPTY